MEERSKLHRADLLICDIPDYRHLTYHFGVNHVDKVIIGGKIIDAQDLLILMKTQYLE